MSPLPSSPPLAREASSQRLEDVAARLSAGPWTYAVGGESCAEPAAAAVVALAARGSWDEARRAALWLASLQASDGSVGVSASAPEPHWPTAWAIVAWQALRLAPDPSLSAFLHQPIERAVAWLLAAGGKTADRSPAMGHDASLQGWSWAVGTHSWLEPTCYGVVALRCCGLAGHPRAREGVQLVLDRLLPQGGANYGNTLVLGNTLLPHVPTTGLALLALAGNRLQDPRIEASLGLLEQRLGPETTAMSLSFALLGLTAWNRRPADAGAWIAHRLQATDVASSPFQQALLLLAASPPEAQSRVLGFAPSAV